jgi:hypothetical protein
MLKLVSLWLETQADTTLHVRELCSQHGEKEMARTGQASTRRSGLESSQQCYQISLASVNYSLIYNY